MSAPRLVAVANTGLVSGAERVLLRTLEAATAEGWDVVALAPDGALVDELRAIGVRRRPIPELNLADGPRARAAVVTVLRWLRAAWVLRGAARGADLVLVNGLLALPALRLASPSAPAVWLAHDVVSGGRLRLYGACRSALTRVVAVSAAVRDRLDAVGGRGPEVVVVHNGVAIQPEPVAGPEEVAGPMVVGLNGLLTPWKGQHVLLDATWRLEPGAPGDREVQVELMGGVPLKDTGYAAGLDKRLAGTPLGERASVLGHVADPLARIRTWTVAVSASTDPEACPLGVLEAMSLGVPVVATNHGGAPEVLDGAGLLVPPGDPKALADAVNELLADPDLRARCAKLGRERVALAHDLTRQTTLLLDTLRETAEAAR